MCERTDQQNAEVIPPVASNVPETYDQIAQALESNGYQITPGFPIDLDDALEKLRSTPHNPPIQDS